MGNRKLALVSGTLALTLMAGTGCVTKKTFRRNVEATDTRVGTVEGAVEANERRIGDLKRDTDNRITAVQGQASQAMSKADSAEQTAQKALKGRLLWTVTLSDEKVKFDFGRAALSQGAEMTLNDLADQVKSYGKAVYVEIEGHTDNVGPDTYNVTLGEKRAAAVRDYLAQKAGLPLHAMNTISYGETQPVANNSTRDGRSQNRRVVIKVLE